MSVVGTVVVNQDVRLRPSAGPLRIEADNFLFEETVFVDLDGSASGTVEFVARESMLIEVVLGLIQILQTALKRC